MNLIHQCDGDLLMLVREVFAGHASVDDAIDYWLEMPAGHLAITPKGLELTRDAVLACVPIARLVQAAQAVLSDNPADLDTDTRSGCWLIAQTKLRQLRAALKGGTYHDPNP